MGISPRRLGEGEHVVVSTRTHVKALLLPSFLLIVICGVTGFVAGLLPQDPPLLVWLLWAVAAVGIARWCVWPYLNWFTASYTLTNRRLITRSGVLTRIGHDVLLRRVNDVWYEHSLLDRVLGCGTLVVAAASERGEVVLHDVPDVEQLHLQMTELVTREHDYDDRYDHDYDDRYDDRYDGRYDDRYDDDPYDDPEPRRRR